MNKDDKILVAGATGMVGSAIVRNLKAKGALQHFFEGGFVRGWMGDGPVESNAPFSRLLLDRLKAKDNPSVDTDKKP